MVDNLKVILGVMIVGWLSLNEIFFIVVRFKIGLEIVFMGILEDYS